MSYKIIIVKCICDGCGKEVILEMKKENFAKKEKSDDSISLSINSPIGWSWFSPSEYSNTVHYCEDEYCQEIYNGRMSGKRWVKGVK